MAIQISDNIASASRTANLDAKFGPYTSKQDVIDHLVADGSDIQAVNGLTVGVIEDGNVVEYVFKNIPDIPTAANVTVNNLFLKQVAVQEETDPTVPAWAKAETKPSYTASEVGAIPDGDKGVAGGVATLGSDGKVPQAQLPSYVDDVLEYSNQSSFPATGESGKIYVALDTNKTYRWSGSAYVEISQSLALGETSSTAFAGDRGKAIEDKIPSGASSSNKMVTASDLNGKVDKVANAQENNFASFDSNGNLQDSLCNEGTFIKGVKKGTETLTPVNGVVTVPSDIESAHATSVASNQSATATIDNNHVLQLEIPRGADAVNPFKGWYNSLAKLKAAHTAIEGDSAYVKDASPATTWSIYVYDSTASSDNYWADSGLDADTSHAQTFAGGEEVNLTPIDDTHLSNPTQNSLPRALDVVGKLNMLGVTTMAKDLIISLFRKCAYTSQDAENIIANLEAEFEGDRVLMGITAELPTSYTFYDNQSLDDLRSILTVTADYDDGSTVSVTTYTLQGNITAGTSVITVSYGGMSTTVEVNVTHIIELTFSNSEFVKKCAADYRYNSVFNNMHYCLSSNTRCAYPFFDKMLSGGRSYRLSISSSDSRTKVGVQGFTDSALAKVANNEDFIFAGSTNPSIDGWDSGWVAFTDGVAIVTIPEKATSDSLSTIRGVRLSIKIDNGTTGGLAIPDDYQLSLTITEIPN